MLSYHHLRYQFSIFNFKCSNSSQFQGPGTMPEPGYEETNGLYANYAPASLYSNYSNYR